MIVSLRNHNININNVINNRIKKCLYMFKNKWNSEYMDEPIFDTCSELNNGIVRIKIRLCLYCNYYIIVNLKQKNQILFKDIINIINIYLKQNYENIIHCKYPTPVGYDHIEALNYIERYNQIETILI